jgi:PLP dependent protein
VSIASNYAEVTRRAAAAARRAGRAADAVRIVAASKTRPASVLIQALDAGVTEFGENRAQELSDKAAVIGDRARWHFIGHLQTNKVRHVVGAVELIHSVERASLAEVIDRRARSLGVTQEVLIEVDLAGQASKHGVEPGLALELARTVESFACVRVRGLMTMPPLPDDPAESRPYFRRLAALRDELVAEVPGATELSMGMTRDFEVAIEQGATIVRVGEAIFGPRAR